MYATVNNPEIQLRQATDADTGRIWEIILQAKAQMHRLNSHQWGENYPTPDLIAGDIKAKTGYVLCLKEEVAAYGVISFEGEEAYKNIEGEWTNTLPYVVVHRLAVADEAKQQGMAKRFMLEAEEISRQRGVYNFRVDTNFDNQYMLRLIHSMGFQYSGEVYYRGDPRKAFEKAILPHTL